MAVKKSSQLTLRDILSRLTLPQAAKWLGADGALWLRECGRGEFELNPADATWPDAGTFQMVVPRVMDAPVVITLTRAEQGRDGMKWACSERDDAPAWVAEVLTFIMEEKTALGLAAAPAEEQALPLELLDEEVLVRRALEDREKRALEEKMEISRAVLPFCSRAGP